MTSWIRRLPVDQLLLKDFLRTQQLLIRHLYSEVLQT